ncbi:DUF4843 domain-containing protein [Sphingobacterium sp. MYb382]|uniref:DUF4843 domain-containing protein n=1 Tax=Sphingobacterium sp. MYb382 TaxID=2745278 RepID=UPI0030A584B6
MKTSIYSLILLGLICFFGSCKKSEIQMYNDVMRIQLLDSLSSAYTFFYRPQTVVRDTFFLPVRTVGGLTNADRPIRLVQESEYRDSVVFDAITKLPIDTVKIPLANPAQAGVHYVAFDSPEMQAAAVIKAGRVDAKIPIILLRDPSLKKASYRLRIALAPNSEFELGEKKSLAMTLRFSDGLERFYSWRFDTGVAQAFITFGKYSTAKHQFIYDVIGEPIDEAWYQGVLAIQGTSQYQIMVKKALNEFNSNPENLASGKAPLREGGPTSPVITFP